MSTLLADIDVTCAALGYFDGEKYYEDADVLQNLKHLLWILHNDNGNYDFLRHVSRTHVLQTDLIPLLCANPEYEVFQTLLRLLIVLTNPLTVLYREGPPKDGASRSVFLEVVDCLTKYKEIFVADSLWTNLALKLHKCLETDLILRGEGIDVLIERILVLVRNVLQIPTNISLEFNTNHGPTTHDQVVWVLQQSGMLDLVLYILNAADEHRFHLHALEIVCLVLKEQTPSAVACISMQGSTPDKHQNDEALVEIRCEEKEKINNTYPRSLRHPRFGGTYVFRNIKSVSDNDMIYHQPLQTTTITNFDREKIARKSSSRLVQANFQNKCRSVYSVRLLLREFCTEILCSAYNTLVRKIRNLLESDTARRNNDDSYLLWTITFFMEFNRLNGLPFELVSESMSVQCFHWVLTEMQHHIDMMETDRDQERIWAKRLNVAIRAFKEMLLSMIGLQKLQAGEAQSLFHILLNNVCGTMEYRECLLQLLLLYRETRNTKTYLQDAMETIYYFIKILKIYKPFERTACRAKLQSLEKRRNEHIDKLWSAIEPTISKLLKNTVEEERVSICDDIFCKEFDEKGDICVSKIRSLLHQGNYEEAIAVTRLARTVWPDKKCFNNTEDEIAMLRNIFALSSREDHGCDIDKTSFFGDYLKRFVNPKVIRTCIIVLTDWKEIKTVVVKSAVTILHSIVTISNCPTFIYQASLFRIFQQAFAARRNQHNMELRRFGTFIVRNFVQCSEINRKIYAELLFYKTASDCSNIENLYREITPKPMTMINEESELHEFLDINQVNLQSDLDVIGKKPAEIEVTFVKRDRNFRERTSTSWAPEEDEKLISLYKEYKTIDENFEIIAHKFDGIKPKDSIIQRLIFLKLTSKTSAIIPTKGTHEKSERQAKLFRVINKKFKDCLKWLKESLTEARDTLNSFCESEDEIPLVPVTKTQSAALIDDDFGSLLLSLGIQPPSNSERFWRIPRTNRNEFEAKINLIEKFNRISHLAILEMENKMISESNESKSEEHWQFESCTSEVKADFSKILQKNRELSNSKNYRVKNTTDHNVKFTGTKRPHFFDTDDCIPEHSSSQKKQKIEENGGFVCKVAVNDSQN